MRESVSDLNALRSLNQITAELQSIKNALQKQAESENEERRTRQQHQDAPSVLRAELKIPHSERYKNETQEARNSVRETWKLYVEVIGFLIVLAYTTIAGFQLVQMKEATKAAVNAAGAAESAADTASTALKNSQIQFRTEERPYVWPTPQPRFQDNSGNPLIIAAPATQGGPFTVAARVDLKNSGRSPAIDIRAAHTEIIIGPYPEALKKAENFSPKYVELGGIMVGGGTGITPQSESKTLSADEMKSFQQGIKKPTLGIFIVGGVQYRDIFQPEIPPYTTTYCFRVLPVGMPFGVYWIRMK